MSPALIVPLVVSCALLVEKIGETVITTSLPELALHFGYSVVTLKLALTSYVVSLGMFIPISGWMADKIGARTVFRAAIVTFMAGSLLCAVSQSLWMFIAARFFQGMAGAMMVPVGRLIIFRSVPKEDLVKAVSYLALPALLGPIFGPPLGGFITTYFHWRWIFLINIPIGFLALFLAGRYMRNFKEVHVAPLDKKGFLLSSISGGSLMLGFSCVASPLIPPIVAVILSCIGVLGLIACYRYAQYATAPMLDFKLLRYPAFRASLLGGSLFRMGLGAIPFLLPLMMQLGLHMNPFESGLVTCSAAMGAIVMKTQASKLLHRFGFKRVLTINALLAGCMMASYSLFNVDTPHWLMFGIILCGGFFPSLQFTGLNALSYMDIKEHDAAAATSLASVVQQMSLGSGVIVGSLVLQSAQELHRHQTLALADFSVAFWVVGLCSILSAYFMRKIPASVGKAAH